MNASKSLLILLLVSIPNFLFAQDNQDLHDRAMNLIKRDASGLRVENSGKCASIQKSMESPWITEEFSNEIIPKELKKTVKDGQNFVIESMTATEDDPDIFEVRFSLRDDKSGQKLVRDHMLMIRHTSEKKIERYGEYEILSPPENFYLYEKCQ